TEGQGATDFGARSSKTRSGQKQYFAFRPAEDETNPSHSCRDCTGAAENPLACAIPKAAGYPGGENQGSDGEKTRWALTLDRAVAGKVANLEGIAVTKPPSACCLPRAYPNA